MMWRELIQKLANEYHFFQPAEEAQIHRAEQTLEVSFPNELRELLYETNGVQGEYGLGLVWSVERIAQENQMMRATPNFPELYMAFDQLLFFADAGNGDLFAFVVLNRAVRRPDIFVWNHEDDSRTWVAPSLQKYLERWLNGTLKV
jgi:SMI1-KNR4 cell-wall